MFYLGIDIGGTNIKVGLFNNYGRLIQSYKIPTPSNNIFYFLKLSFLEHEFDLEYCVGIGIGVPCPIKDNVILYAPNINLSVGINLEEEFQKLLNKKIKICFYNDANLAALGEYYKSNIKGIAYFITLGTGVGGALIVNGNIIEGVAGLTGEIGHIQIDAKKKKVCGCGGNKHIESYIGVKGTISRFNELSFTKVSDIKEIKNLLDKGSKEVLILLNEYVSYLQQLLDIINKVVNPDDFIFGGGLTDAFGDVILPLIKEKMPSINIRKASLGNEAGFYGAYYLLTKNK